MEVRLTIMNHTSSDDVGVFVDWTKATRSRQLKHA
jgi:hypothetical protein